MKNILILITILFTSSAYAELYEYKDRNGNIVIEDRKNEVPAKVPTNKQVIINKYPSTEYENKKIEVPQIIIKDTNNNITRLQRKPEKAAIAGMFAMGAGLMILPLIIGIALFITWIISLIDVIHNDFTDSKNKTMWIILLLVIAPIAGILYQLIGKNQKVNRRLQVWNR